MIIDVWDILGTEMFARFTADAATGEVADAATSESLRRVLSCPRAGLNRKPHLLDPGRPDISDLLDENGNITEDICERSWLLRELLLPQDRQQSPQWQKPPQRSADGRWPLFQSWFDAQRGVLADDAFEKAGSADAIVLAIPDFLGILVQEALLANSGFDRTRTRLLWRPVAAVLGAEESLRRIGARVGDRVAVIDWAPDDAWCDICFLQLVTPTAGDWPDKGRAAVPLVPCRSAIPPRPGEVCNYGFYQTFSTRGAKTGSAQDRFDLATRREGSFYLPDGHGGWTLRQTTLPDIARRSLRNVTTTGNDKQRIAALVTGCRCAISLGVPFHPDAPFPKDVPILREADGENWVALGCARFAVRSAAGLPTYYDEVQPLRAIGQDKREERIVAVDLIPPKTKWPGGRTLAGAPYSAQLAATSGDASRKPFVDFRLHLGTLDRFTPLSRYRHEFDIQLDRPQDITLHPSIVAGQGLARVEARGVPGAENGSVFLRLEEMSPETEREGFFSVPITMDLLEKRIPRSFPPDIPHVLPDPAKWDAVRDDVLRYLQTGEIDPGAFARAENADTAFIGNARIDGLAALQRTNIFGSDPQKALPPNADKAEIAALFDRLLADWQWYQTRRHPPGMRRPVLPENNLVRLIAWTYNAEFFGDVVDAVLSKAENMAARGGVGLLSEEYSLLAYLVRTPSRQHRFMAAFAHQWQRYHANSETTFKEWVRAASYVLMLNNDATSNQILGNSRNCRNLMRDFHITLGRFNSEGAGVAYYKHLFRAMIFLLRRRRIDHDFIPTEEGADWLMRDLPARLRETIGYFGGGSPVGRQANAVLQYLLGKGTLEGAMLVND